jgi:hypothetical protein
VSDKTLFIITGRWTNRRNFNGLLSRALYRDKISVWAAASAIRALNRGKMPAVITKSALYRDNARLVIRSSDRSRSLARLAFRAGLIADLRDNALFYARSTIAMTFAAIKGILSEYRIFCHDRGFATSRVAGDSCSGMDCG